MLKVSVAAAERLCSVFSLVMCQRWSGCVISRVSDGGNEARVSLPWRSFTPEVVGGWWSDLEPSD